MFASVHGQTLEEVVWVCDAAYLTVELFLNLSWLDIVLGKQVVIGVDCGKQLEHPECTRW